MIRNCIVHIGMHKTGSSSIQNALFKNLADPRFEYADLGKANHSNIILNLFQDEPIKHWAYKKLGLSKAELNILIEKNFKQFIKGLQNNRSSTVIFSAEVISYFTESALLRFHTFISEYFEKITIVGYIRPPCSFMESIFQQRVKLGGLNKLDVYKLYPHYQEKFSLFDPIFGRENVHYWKFNPKIFPQNNVVLDFCQRLNINMPSNLVIKINESISKEALAILFAYRKYGPGYGIGSSVILENKIIVNKLSMIGKRKIKFAPELVRPVLEKNRSDIEWMETRLEDSLAEDIQPSDDDIRSEDDLLNIRMPVVDELKQLLGEESIPDGITGETAQEVAQLVHILRLKLNKLNPRIRIGKNSRRMTSENILSKFTSGNIQMKITELIEHVQKTDPKLLEAIPEKKAVALIRNVFKHIGDTLAETNESVVRYQKLGRFLIKKIQKGEDETVRTRIIFRPAGPNKKKETNANNT